MAYDEHWSGSLAGSIASIDWCKRVAAYAQSRIAPERLVMGLPFYGRAWADKSLSKAYKFSSVERVMGEEKIKLPKREGDIPWFEYSSMVKVKVYYEDAQSIATRLALYRDAGVSMVAFWRLGQEDGLVWKNLEVLKAGPY